MSGFHPEPERRSPCTAAGSFDAGGEVGEVLAGEPFHEFGDGVVRGSRQVLVAPPHRLDDHRRGKNAGELCVQPLRCRVERVRCVGSVRWLGWPPSWGRTQSGHDGRTGHAGDASDTTVIIRPVTGGFWTPPPASWTTWRSTSRSPTSTAIPTSVLGCASPGPTPRPRSCGWTRASRTWSSTPPTPSHPTLAARRLGVEPIFQQKPGSRSTTHCPRSSRAR